VGHLDAARARLEGGEGVERALHAVARRDVGLEVRDVVHPVGLVVDDERRPAGFLGQEVDDAGQERELGVGGVERQVERRLPAQPRRRGGAGGQRRGGKGTGEGQRLLGLLGREREVELGQDVLEQRGTRGPIRIGVLEERVDDDAAQARVERLVGGRLGRGVGGGSGRGARGRRLLLGHAEDAAGVVPVAARGVLGQLGVGEVAGRRGVRHGRARDGRRGGERGGQVDLVARGRVRPDSRRGRLGRLLLPRRTRAAPGGRREPERRGGRGGRHGAGHEPDAAEEAQLVELDLALAGPGAAAAPPERAPEPGQGRRRDDSRAQSSPSAATPRGSGAPPRG
jgi:hypothetical protein